MSFLSLLIGLSLAWLAIRFISDLPRQLPALLEKIGKIILLLLIKLGGKLALFIFTRAYRTLQYLLSTPQAHQLRRRLEDRLQEIFSFIYKELKL